MNKASNHPNEIVKQNPEHNKLMWKGTDPAKPEYVDYMIEYELGYENDDAGRKTAQAAKKWAKAFIADDARKGMCLEMQTIEYITTFFMLGYRSALTGNIEL